MNVNFDTPGRVTNTSDAGPGSLRQAILEANSHANDSGVPDKIIFSIPGVGPFSIMLASALPEITDAVNIDGSTQPGTGSTPSVAVDGSLLAGSIDGLAISSTGSIVRKLNIRKFPGSGIKIHADGVLIADNTIGTDWGGVTAGSNAGNGILIQGGSNNRIEANVVSANGLSGIAVVGESADGNQLVSNVVGARFGGGSGLGNIGNGVTVTDGDSNLLSNNLISANKQSGVMLTGTAVTNTLTGNKIARPLQAT